MVPTTLPRLSGEASVLPAEPEFVPRLRINRLMPYQDHHRQRLTAGSD